MIKLNRIGNKLGLAGAVGILLAAGMVANQMITEAKIAGVSERAGRSQQVADNSLSAHIDLRKIQLAARDVRLARTPAEVDKTIADLQRLTAKRRNSNRRSQPPMVRRPGSVCRRSNP